MMEKAELTSLLGGKVKIWQPARGGYRTGIDPVFLAASLPVTSGDHVVELGTGVGAAMFCLLARCPDITVTGLDYYEGFLRLARRNIIENKPVSKNARILEADIAEKPEKLKGHIGLADAVMANPPFFAKGTGFLPKDESRSVALYENSAKLSQWVQLGMEVLRPGGLFLLIWPEKRREELCLLFRKAGVQKLQFSPLISKENRVAKRVLILAKTQEGDEVCTPSLPCEECEPLIVHEEKGEWTEKARRILYQGDAWMPWKLDKTTPGFAPALAPSATDLVEMA